MATEWNFDYTSTEQSVTLKPGKYKLECWGAGANTIKKNDYDIYPSYGGYSCGELILKKETILYIYVGQYGNGANDAKFIFNGGGKGLTGRGGGATDIRLIGGEWDNERGLLSRIIVAGGAGFGSGYSYSGSHGGGLKGNNGGGFNNSYTVGATQFDGGRGNGGNKDYLDGFFGKGGSTSTDISNVAQCGGGGGWFGGAGSSTSSISGGGGSGYVLTKDSYKPTGYIPTSEYWLENIAMTVGGNTTKSTGYARITLLQALPFLTISSYNSTTTIFKADHTEPALLTKIECFIDDTLKETITTDLTLEKTINYILEDNALHTLKIVVTDSANATVEKVLSISKNIMPLPEENVNLNDISTKLVEVNSGFKVGKTSIINTLALKNIEASLNNTLVELSEKIKTSFNSSDASVQDLQNRITELNNQLSQRKKWASGIYTNTTKIIFNENPGIINVPINLDFIPSLVIVFFDISFYRDSSSEYTTVHSSNNKQETFSIRGTGETFTGDCKTIIKNISQSKFDIEFFRVDSRRDGYTRKEQIINWYAYQ
ncbi:hypothetical protein LW316_10495 [Clostridioides difficile]|nr:hypothetical protein [Clostridioides difficile]MCP3278021.1 glycine rich domain-containing protein [Clostridioides difficile]HCQ5967430.1 hypothetical protein [Clostridioides difficile]